MAQDTKTGELAGVGGIGILGVDMPMVQRVLGSLMGRNLDEAELYFQTSACESWSLTEGVVKEMHFDTARGAGARATKEDVSGYAYTDEIEMPTLLSATAAARSITASGKSAQVQLRPASTAVARYDGQSPFSGVLDQTKVDLLHSIDAMARKKDPCIKEVMVSLTSSHETILVASSDGTLVGDVRPLVRLNVSVVAESRGRKEHGSNGIGGRFTLEKLLAEHDQKDFVGDAVRQALVNLESIPAPFGEMDVVLGPGWPGVMLHEAVGHGLEGDFCRKKTSVFSGRIGEKVASSEVTVIDDGTIADRRGSLTVDDEGTPTKRNVLIEKGIIKGFMYDKLNARLANTAPTGNGRRQSYAHQPMPRMTNTFMTGGDYSPEEIIKCVKKGIYAVNFGGGQVDITSGQFVFSANESYLIENGKVGAPIKGVSLIGSGHQALKQIKMVGNDMRLDKRIGTCGKHGQMVPVGVGQPSVLIEKLTVGGAGS